MTDRGGRRLWWAVGVAAGLGCRPHQVRPLPPGPTVELMPPPAADLVYLVMVDRFDNGDPSNDHELDPTDPHGWHGGDLRGVLNRLDHLEALGVRTVWLTPLTDARDEKVGEWGAFHGYWLRDPWRMEPRFGTVAELRALSDALHARDMRLVVDMVWNHTDYDAPIRTAHPEWFHQTGDIVDWDDPVQRVQGRVHGLPDLAQEDPAVRAWLRGAAEAWVDRAGLDGLRIDAVGHMPQSFLAHMNQALDAHARARGNPDGLWTLAEDFTGDPMALADTVENGGFDAIFDFALHYALVDVACREADPLRLAATLALDRHGPPARARVTFLDNHDLPRVAHVCAEDGASAELAAARLDAAFLLLFTMRGTPSLTWGTEARVSAGEEPATRPSLPWDAVGQRTPLLAMLARLRAAHPALSDGTSEVVGAGPGYLRLLRSGGGEVAVIDVVADGFDPTLLPPVPGEVRVSTVWWAHRGPAGTDGTWVSTRTTPTPEPLGGPTDVAAWTVRVSLGHRPSVGGRSKTAPVASPDPHLLEVTVRGAPSTGELRLVGADPALGAWDPSRAARADPDHPDHFRVRLRDGDVPTFKAVMVDDRGAATWSPAPDRAVFLAPERDRTALVIDWSPEPTGARP